MNFEDPRSPGILPSLAWQLSEEEGSDVDNALSRRESIVHAVGPTNSVQWLNEFDRSEYCLWQRYSIHADSPQNSISARSSVTPIGRQDSSVSHFVVVGSSTIARRTPCLSHLKAVCYEMLLVSALSLVGFLILFIFNTVLFLSLRLPPTIDIAMTKCSPGSAFTPLQGVLRVETPINAILVSRVFVTFCLYVAIIPLFGLRVASFKSALGVVIYSVASIVHVVLVICLWRYPSRVSYVVSGATWSLVACCCIATTLTVGLRRIMDRGKSAMFWFVCILMLFCYSAVARLMSYFVGEGFTTLVVAFCCSCGIKVVETVARHFFCQTDCISSFASGAFLFFMQCGCCGFLRRALANAALASDLVGAIMGTSFFEFVTRTVCIVYCLWRSKALTSRGLEQLAARQVYLNLLANISKTVADQVALSQVLTFILFADRLVFDAKINVDISVALRSWAAQFAAEVAFNLLYYIVLFTTVPLSLLYPLKKVFQQLKVTQYCIFLGSILYSSLASLELLIPLSNFLCE